MTSRNLQYYNQSDFRGGICDNQESLNPKNQVLDARNVWTNLGTLVRRPGYSAIAQYTQLQTSLSASFYIDGSTVYFGAASTFYNVGFRPDVANANTDCFVRLEYWNGTAWMSFDFAQSVNGTNTPVYFPVTTPTSFLYFVPPANWAQTTVNDLTKYWIRYVPTGINSPSALPTDIPVLGINAIDVTAGATLGLFQFRYNAGTNFLWGLRRKNALNDQTLLSATYSLAGGVPTTTSIGPSITAPVMQATCIPEFNRAYATYNNIIYEVLNDNTISVAQVNSDPLIVGTNPTDGAPYRADLVPQLSAFPEANLIINFRNLIFAAGIKGQPTLVRWSGAVNEAAFNVWPETSFETLSTAKDNSPITAMAGLGDNLVVFKQDSIWQLIYNGLDDQDLPTFVPQLVVAGVGCVSQGSIQEVRGRLIFLAEDGFYAFDGTPNIKKISENVNTTAARINPAHRPFATAVNWRSKYAYLCSVALDESTSNNIIFVYDYKHDAWWLWDDIPAEFLLVTSDTALQEQVIFGNQTAGFFQLGGETDNFGPIDNYVLTGRMGQDDVLWKTCRDVRLRELNIDGTTTFTLYGDDLELGVSSQDLRMDSPDETQVSPAPANGCDNVQIRRRERKKPQRLTGEWFQVKAEGFSLLEGISLGWLPESRR